MNFIIVVDDGGELVTVRVDELALDLTVLRELEGEINRVLDARSEATAKAETQNKES